ncbi:MAG: TonB family protein [Pyrinomonadaceae bacterium]
MPLNVRRLYSSVLLVLSGFILITGAQTPPQNTPQIITPPAAPTSGDVMRDRISKAKAFIAVRNYSAAIYELENIRRETNDAALKGVVNVLLMNSYLEQGDYTRAQSFLTQFFNEQKTAKPNASAAYTAVAAQIIKGARSRVERYQALGLRVSDRTLPLEATNDLEKMRETLELVITQSKEIGKDKVKTPDAMALLEEASNSRSMLARDDYDARRWTNEVADTRETLANSSKVVLDASTGAPANIPTGELVAVNQKPLEKPPVVIPAVVENKTVPPQVNDTKPAENKPSDQTVAANDKPAYVPLPPPTVTEEPKKEEPKPVIQTPNTAPVNDGSPMEVGSSLIAYATSKTQPIYPSSAKSLRATGVVKVEVTVSETGEVSQVQKTSGPPLLQAAAKDAIRKWRFKPFLRDGQPVKATGFVSFNFAL